MAELKGTRTEANLQTAFAGESMARNKYTFFASKAKKDGYVQIAKIFEETAANEKEHAKIWFKLLNGGIDDTADAFGGQRRQQGLPVLIKGRIVIMGVGIEYRHSTSSCCRKWAAAQCRMYAGTGQRAVSRL